ncbi:MAG: Uncharacterised protein [Formosa sp. Hel3_A1_48]|nr:MAG: Uncharacterised protein [Formosa sp. Hel3_A1_48]
MKDNIFKYYTELPQWAKGAVVIAATAAVGFVGYKVYRMVFPSDSEKQAQQLLNTIQNDIARWEREGLTPSYPEVQYQAMASSAYDGMRYCAGDNYTAVEEILKKMQNNLDVSLLVSAFGIRQNFCFGIPTGTPLDLFSFVKRELGDEWGGLTDYRIKRINDNWQKKGITYKV